MQNPKNRKPISFLILGCLTFFICACSKENSLIDNENLILGFVVSQNEVPLLNDLEIQTSVVNNSQLITITFSFRNAFLQNYSINAYLGRPETIQLQPDGVTVGKYLQEAGEVSPFSKQIRFSPPEAGASYKIIVVAKNTHGVSVKQGICKPPVVAGACSNALNAGTVADPLVIGNCNEYCMKVSLNGNNMEMKVDYNAEAASYFYMDLFSWKLDGNIAAFNFTELFPADPATLIPPGPKVVETFLDTTTLTDVCVYLDSVSIFQKNQTTPIYKTLNTRIVVP